VRILVDVSHPAHVHFFRHAIYEFRRRGHTVRIVSRVKDLTVPLLDALGLTHEPISVAPSRRSAVTLGRELLIHLWRLARIARTFRPDVMLQVAGTFIAPVGFLLRRPAVVFYDTEIARWSNALTYPLATAVCTPDCYQGSAGPHHVRYPGYHELAYLHPSVFTPDPSRLPQAGISATERFFIVRFVNWAALHDYRHAGFAAGGKVGLVEALARHGRVLVSSESALPDELEPYRLAAPVEAIHDLMAFATLVIGESATMASEAAVLGVPAIFMSSSPRGYTTEQERRYGLVRTFRPEQAGECLQAALDVATRPLDDLRREYTAKRARLLADHVSTTAWMVDYVETTFG
jgi:predicted glycosyltransferase